MKSNKTILSLVLFSLLSTACVAQNNRPVKAPLFNALSKEINCTSMDLDKFFTIDKVQRKIQSSISNQLNINGIIVSNTDKFPNLRSINIKLPEYNDAIFSISKRIDENNKQFFVGHIIQQNSSDGYELKRTGENTYQFVKINMNDILPVCAQ